MDVAATAVVLAVPLPTPPLAPLLLLLQLHTSLHLFALRKTRCSGNARFQQLSVNSQGTRALYKQL